MLILQFFLAVGWAGDGLSPLHIAAGAGDTAQIEKLLKNGADVFSLDSKMGVSVLHKAVYSGNSKAVELILKNGAFINLQSPSNGDTPLHDAIYFKKDLAVIKALLAYKPSLAIKNRAGLDPIAAAKLLQEQDVVRLLEQYERKRQSPASRALMTAVRANNLTQVKALLQKSKPLAEADDQGFTPLLWSAREGYADVVKELLKNGADPNQNDQWMGANSGHKAAFWGRTEVIKILIAGGLDLNARGGYNGYTSLHDAVSGNHVDTAEVLVGAGAAVDVKGHDGKTAMDIAKAMGNTKMIKVLTRKK